MKTYRIVTAVLFLILFFGQAFGQDRAKALSQTSIVWFGVDFTNAKFTMVTEDPAVIVDQYFKSINLLILQESEKFDIKKFFKKSEVTNDIDIVTESNSKVDPKGLVINDEYKFPAEDVSKIIRKYKTAENTGTGLVFIAENLNKIAQYGSYYVCFFDIASKEIIDCQRYSGKAAGFGFRNYWAGSIYNVMKNWASQK
jgi:hypothetical protein